ncbi:IS4 family transposase, partial [Aestuariicella hydrocarbonica]
MAHSSTVLSQILRLVPRHEFQTLAQQHDGNRRKGSFSRWSQFVSLSMAQLTGRSSLRDIEMAMDSHRHINYHLGCQPVKKSTLARCNENLSGDFYQALFYKLYQRCSNLLPGRSFRLKNKLFSIDSSIIDVSMKIFPQANYNTMKAAYKLHIGLDHDGMIPAFATVTHGKESDMSQARLFQFPKGSVVVFDRGYNDFSWHNLLTDKGISFVTRIRANALYKVLERRSCSKYDCVTSDQLIEYTGAKAKKEHLHPVRRIGYKDSETGKHYVFITNNMDWSPDTVASIYKQRWQVELFFKWIKQNLKIKSFIGNTENAVKTQIFSALCVYMLLAFIRFQSKAEYSFQKVLRLIQVNAFSKK